MGAGCSFCGCTNQQSSTAVAIAPQPLPAPSHAASTTTTTSSAATPAIHPVMAPPPHPASTPSAAPPPATPAVLLAPNMKPARSLPPLQSKAGPATASTAAAAAAAAAAATRAAGPRQAITPPSSEGGTSRAGPTTPLQPSPSRGPIADVQAGGGGKDYCGEGLPPVACRGISLRALRKLYTALACKRLPGLPEGTLPGGRAHAELVTTEDLVSDWVVPMTKARQCRLVDMPGGAINPEDVGVPMYFVSHAWGNPLSLLVAVVEDFLGNAHDSTRVWLDFAAVNEHSSNPQNGEDVAGFADVIHAAVGGTIVALAYPAGKAPRVVQEALAQGQLQLRSPATRAWCLFEWDHTVADHGPDGLHMALGDVEQRVALFNSINVREAQCFMPADKAMILGKVVEHHGSCDAFDAKLKLQLLLEPLSYKVDLATLTKRADPAGFDFSCVQAWLDEWYHQAPPPQQQPTVGDTANATAATPASRGAGPVSAQHEGQGAHDGRNIGNVGSSSSLTNGSAPAGTTSVAAFTKTREPVTDGSALRAAAPGPVAEGVVKDGEKDWDDDDWDDEDSSDDDDDDDYDEDFWSDDDTDGDDAHLKDGKEDGDADADDDISTCSRVLCLVAGAGTGKSSVSAALVSHPQLGSAISAFHFLKYNDQRRLEPVRVVKSLAFQLATRYPELWQAHYSQLDVAAVAGLGDVEQAFDLLIRQPLKKLRQLQQGQQVSGTGGGVDGSSSSGEAAKGQEDRSASAHPPAPAARAQPVVLLLDALDEADPTQEQAADVADRTVIPAGNKALQLVLNQLAKLPSHVRFIFTTRPDAVYGLVLEALERAFPGRVQQVLPHQLRRHALPSGASPGADGDRLRSQQQQAASSGVMIYHTVVNEVLRPMGLSPPQIADPAAPNLDDLYALYALIFDTAASGLAPHTAEGVTQLLQVLMAAQEPLPQSLLQRMGLDHALPRLPGYGVFFFTAEHHVYTLHKSLCDWLLWHRGVDVQQGHLQLGLHLATTHDLARPTPYMAKYLALHLAAHPDGAEQLDRALHGYAFIGTVVGAGHLHRLLGALLDGSSDAKHSRPPLSPFATDVARWLRLQGHSIKDEGSAFREALYSPVSTMVFRAAEAVARRNGAQAGWRTRDVWCRRKWPVCYVVAAGHTGCVAAVAFSPDGKSIASASDDNTVKLWDAATGTCTATLQGHSDFVNGVAFSPDGRAIASASDDTTVRVWDAATCTCTGVLKGHTEFVWNVVFSPDGKTLVSCSDDTTVKVWEVATGACTATLQGHSSKHVRDVAISPDGKAIASAGDDKTVRVWDAATGTITATLEGHEKMVTCVAFSPDSKTIVSTCDDSTVRVWDVASGACKATLQGHTDSVWAAAFSPDGNTIVTGSDDKTLKLWDAATGSCMTTLQGHTKLARGVAFSPDGMSIASASDDKTWRLWDTSAVAAAALGTAHLEGHTNWVRCVAFSPDGSAIASTSDDQNIKVWDAATGACTATLQGHDECVNSVAFSPDATTLVSASDDNSIRLWDAVTGACTKQLKGHKDMAYGAVFSPDGRTIVSVSTDRKKGNVKLWDVATGKCSAVLQGHIEGVRAVAFSPGGIAVATGGDDNNIRLWEVASCTCKAVLEGHEKNVCCVAFSPDGKVLASSSDDKTVRLWDVTSSVCTATLQGHTKGVMGVAFSPDGSLIASASDDGTVRVWEAATGSCRATLLGHVGNVNGVAFSPDGRTLASAGSDNTIRLWEQTQS